MTVDDVRLQISGLNQSVRLGCTDEERSFPQVVVFDLMLEVQAADSLLSDSVNDTVDYVAIVGIVEQLTRECSWKLIEKMNADVGKEIMKAFSRVKLVTVTSCKRILPQVSGISCSITLRRVTVHGEGVE